MDRLPEDILIKIFKLLPFKSIHSCRWVSKPWLDLVSTLILPKTLPAADQRCIVCDWRKGAAFLGDDCGDGDIDIGMPYLPLEKWDSLTVLDCSNGLVLCSTEYGRKHYVCNPATKSWALLPLQDREFAHDLFHTKSYLGFKPWASPHYTVLSVHFDHRAWSMYSSRTGKWGRPRRPGGEPAWPYRDQYVTMWRGHAYVVRRRPIGAFTKVRVETTRFRLADGKKEVVRFPEIAKQLIVFNYSKIQPDTCIGRLGGEVCLAILTGLGLTVWRLNGREWALKHASNIEALPLVDPPRIHSFWMPNSVFLRYGCWAYLYDLDTMTLDEGRPLDQDQQLFPFSPCYFEVFADMDEMVEEL